MSRPRSVHFEAVRQAVPVEEYLRSRGWRPVRREPAGLRGPCPAHGSHSPRSRSLSVSVQHWYCHVCHKGGDVIALHQVLRGLLGRRGRLIAATELAREWHVARPPRGAT